LSSEETAMPELTAKLVEIFSLGGSRAGILNLPHKAWPSPGQYLPAQALTGSSEILPTPLFRVGTDSEHLALAPLPASWQPGDRLALLPAQGQGFHLPASARRVALGAIGVAPSRLMPLIPLALDQNATVTLFCDPQPTPDILHQIPSVVEIAPLSALLDNLDWPDYLALDMPRESLPQLNEMIPLDSTWFEGQVLVRTDMPCHGLGDCGVCAVTTRHGMKLACSDGPVFDLNEVLHVAE
jgi:dihydroorotate dehydrogenase electron transfer subunit